MQVTLLDDHPDLSRFALRKVWVAARGCYSTDTPAALWEKSATLPEEKMLKVVRDQVIDSGHLSCLRHVSLTFSVSGISRACSHQLVRHHVGVDPEQQSQRYVTASLGSEDFVVPTTISRNDDALNEFRASMSSAMEAYNNLRSQGIPDEDARAVLPNATPTNLTLTVNLNALINLCRERLCCMAQEEIRLLVAKMRTATVKEIKWLRPHLTIKCIELGYCPESRNKKGDICKIRPPKKTVTET